MSREKRDRLNPEQMDRDVLRILELVVEVRHIWGDAVDGGVYPLKAESNGRGRGFEDSDPTHSAATRPTQRQLRGSARHAASLISEAKDRLEDAATALHRGLFRLDSEVYFRDLEKTRAATQDR